MNHEKILKHDFLKSLADSFGPSFLECIQEPQGTQVGERVLYKFIDNTTAQRRTLTGQQFQSLRLELEALAGETLATVTLEAPGNSGLDLPRTADLIEADTAMQLPAERWVNSETLLPRPDYKLEWLLGTIHWSDHKELLYIDFTDPKVKCTLCADFDDLYDTDLGEDMQTQFENILAARAELLADPTIEWAKLASIGGKIIKNIRRA